MRTLSSGRYGRRKLLGRRLKKGKEMVMGGVRVLLGLGR